MDRNRLFVIFEALDGALQSSCELEIRGGAAVLALGLEGRTTLDVDVLPSSRFVDLDLRRSCAAAGVDFNPTSGKDLTERDFLEVVPEETLVLPIASPERPYNTVFRGRRLTVRTAPVAVFAASAAVVAGSGGAGLRAFLALLVAGYAAILGFGALLLVASSQAGRFGAAGFVRALASPLLLAFSTASGAAALPGAMEALERWGASRRSISFVLPLGYSFNLTGTSVYLPLVTLFWAQLNGVALGWADQAMLVATVLVVVRGLPPVPRALFLVWGGILTQFHLPPEGLVIMLGIDPLLDMARTVVNVGGNCLAVATLARLDRGDADRAVEKKGPIPFFVSPASRT